MANWSQEVPQGTIESVDGYEPAFRANVNFGADWSRFDADQTHARLQLKIVGRTEEGSSISLDYNSIMRVDEAVAKVFGMQPDAESLPFSNIGTGDILAASSSNRISWSR